ncbi:MAG: response regulator transcription factor [Deltaproteobacteria bacterium]|nr:response regulator transcription factor [Deltaproteobacteria bacterium]
MTNIKVMLVDDHTIMREGLRALLSKAGDLEIVAMAANGIEALDTAIELNPDVIVMDLAMPDKGGVEATRKIIETNPNAKILALSMALDKKCVMEGLKAGAKGYLLKDCASEELLRAIRTLADGGSYLCSGITDFVINDYTQRTSDELAQSKDPLSKREREVLQLIAEGKNAKEIAYMLGVSAKTIEVQRSNIMKKLDLYSIAQLTKYAVRAGLSSVES